ncbi:unnamed protein product [Rotaria magnacalcarata]|uniref:Uncharacterized protein n=1 Tax=Rotaria magnacalcarata TaxID=392030 RepID=A0A819JZM1_9BILA|nr:unnamed protein product [Rotaria magnacalcarata]CAF3942076.1 unnamed protein product [Rotaria magnacalcarata]
MSVGGEKGRHTSKVGLRGYSFNRIGGYAFNLSGGLVNVSSNYPTGCTQIFKNGIERDLDSLLGYSIVSQNGKAPMHIETRQLQSCFKGAIGKVAVFDYELNSKQMQIHFNCMVTNANCTGG